MFLQEFVLTNCLFSCNNKKPQDIIKEFIDIIKTRYDTSPYHIANIIINMVNCPEWCIFTHDMIYTLKIYGSFEYIYTRMSRDLYSNPNKKNFGNYIIEMESLLQDFIIRDSKKFLDNSSLSYNDILYSDIGYPVFIVKDPSFIKKIIIPQFEKSRIYIQGLEIKNTLENISEIEW